MIAIGNLGTDLTPRTNRNTGKTFYVARLAVSTGKDQYRVTDWVDLTLNISEEQADLLRKGMFVKVTGRVTADVFNDKPVLRMSASKIEPYVARSQAPEHDDIPEGIPA